MLIIDDDEVALRRHHAAFSRLGWQVTCTGDVNSAVRLAGERQPHVVVTELAIAEARGVHLQQRLRAAIDHTVLLVAVTRLPRQVFVPADLKGFDGAFAKPIAPSEVHQWLETRLS